ncbi:hypothetical protein PBY51_021632 [Eleginops maclovinus]|uniref:Uncharacterized protein n=1 Tax=Eleginops maclovinus TaxID=56733 RepID=A0AAN7XDM3_ELEMC|nr:hypothetical protein PBY51_021632 [Eleginops maclovinus]
MRALLVLVSALIPGLFGSPVVLPEPVPYHAFCKTLWLFGMPCDDVGSILVQQILTFSPVNVCEKCHYMLVSTSNMSIEVLHNSSENLHSESIEFILHTTVLTGSCRVSAQSSSLALASLLDVGLNYCNLNNLLTASGLNLAPGFTEMTSEWACLGYGFATCVT